MPTRQQSGDSLRERKQRRAREAIIEAAHVLFAERGYDAVTVDDIAAEAEVGRSTFFRYFGDKREVIFAESGEVKEILAASLVPSSPPIGDSLPDALAYVRELVVAYMRHVTASRQRYLLHERLVAEYPELYARSLVKHRRHAADLTEALTARGAEPATATLAAEIGLACYLTGHAAAGNDPKRLPPAVDAAFARLDVSR